MPSPCNTPALIGLIIASVAPLTSSHAQGLFTTHRLSADLANQAAAETVASCAKQGYSVTGVVVDADGVRQAVLRGDRAGSHTLDSANDKAYTAASFKTDTSALVERSKTVPGFANLFTQLPHLILLGGGIVIKIGDELVGAIGVAGAPGANLDEACARAGLDKIRDQLK
ncbi:MAG: heme-binding protein [Acetobacteraceae bacterium]|nr:heme-binding protein [Acetobacteraceae bacterium]